MYRYLSILILALLAASCGRADKAETPDEPAAQAEEKAAPPSEEWKTATEGLERRAGFVDLYVNKKDGKVLAAFPAPDAEGLSMRAIYAASLTAGLGSNPIGLDRGYFDEGSVVAFRRVGGKLVAEQENWTYRASADNPLEKKAVRDSFARSFLWSGDIAAEGSSGEMLVDLSSFLTRDALSIKSTLANHPQGGNFSIAGDRSFPDTDNALAFPDNVEFDAYITLTSDAPKSEVWATAADARSVTMIAHHSLVRLPDDGYKPRLYDDRSGAIEVPFYDFSAPLAGDVRQGFARRFRLEKQDPLAAKSPAKKPLVFYVDSGAPEDIRNALIEGAAWWADAFEAAGFPDSFRVEVLPAGVHPRDARYNTIMWTHRQTRGWSYGGGIYDPRTGEMIKANVILGSQRVRQDRMIFEGLAGADKSGTGAADDPVQIALARIRQLSAHEVGHTLGFNHNFAASSNDRASVMDYPAPDIRATEAGGLDFSGAYAVGAGDWDKVSTTWLYAQFPQGADEKAELNKILSDGYASGLRYIQDGDGRSVSTGHPYASVWDNGADPVAALEETMRVRRIALNAFSARSIKAGRPMSDLRKVIVPVYLYHRYEVAAAAKLVGGLDFNYAVKGDALPAAKPVADADQRRALETLIATLDPAALDLPDALLNRLSPQANGETFDGDAGPMFDLIAAADTSAAMTIDALLNPSRAARLVEMKRRDAANLGLVDVLQALEQAAFANAPSPRTRAIQRQQQIRFVSALIDLSGNERAAPAVRAVADARLRSVANRLSPTFFGGDATARDHNAWLARRIEAHLTRPAEPAAPQLGEPEAPPGSPIGSTAMEDCWHCDTAIR